MKTYSMLLVEDDFLVLSTLENMLNKSKFAADAVSTGEAAIKKLHNNHYDFVLSDLTLPDISGLEVLAEAKRLNPVVSAILLTGQASVKSISKSLDIGISDYMVKPIDRKEFSNRLDECIKRYEFRKRTREIENKFYHRSDQDFNKPDPLK